MFTAEVKGKVLSKSKVGKNKEEEEKDLLDGVNKKSTHGGPLPLMI